MGYTAMVPENAAHRNMKKIEIMLPEPEPSGRRSWLAGHAEQN